MKKIIKKNNEKANNKFLVNNYFFNINVYSTKLNFSTNSTGEERRQIPTWGVEKRYFYCIKC